MQTLPQLLPSAEMGTAQPERSVAKFTSTMHTFQFNTAEVQLLISALQSTCFQYGIDYSGGDTLQGMETDAMYDLSDTLSKAIQAEYERESNRSRIRFLEQKLANAEKSTAMPN